jgi:hypothetical protein
MPFQVYQANVIFGANTTGPIVILGNTIQEVAETALRAMDQNSAVLLANGESRNAAIRNPTVIGTIFSNTRSAFVLVRDPSVTPFNSPSVFGANAFNVSITTTGYVDSTRPVVPTQAGTGTAGTTFVSQTYG